MENKTKVYDIFTSIADKYDRLNTVLSFNTDKKWRKKAVDICSFKENDKVLDLCCGTGQMIAYITNKADKNIEIIGLDFNEKMIRVGYERLGKILEGRRFSLVKGDMLELPFENSTFDCVTVAFGLRNAPDKYKALSEIYRVLKPGGKLVCLELSNPEAPVFKNLYAVYFNHFLPLMGYIGTGDKSAYFYLRDSVKKFLSKDALKQAFNEAGFTSTGYIGLTGGIAAIHYGNKIA